jgi:hypothetical protein
MSSFDVISRLLHTLGGEKHIRAVYNNTGKPGDRKLNHHHRPLIPLNGVVTYSLIIKRGLKLVLI